MLQSKTPGSAWMVRVHVVTPFNSTAQLPLDACCALPELNHSWSKPSYQKQLNLFAYELLGAPWCPLVPLGVHRGTFRRYNKQFSCLDPVTVHSLTMRILYNCWNLFDSVFHYNHACTELLCLYSL